MLLLPSSWARLAYLEYIMHAREHFSYMHLYTCIVFEGLVHMCILTCITCTHSQHSVCNARCHHSRHRKQKVSFETCMVERVQAYMYVHSLYSALCMHARMVACLIAPCSTTQDLRGLSRCTALKLEIDGPGDVLHVAEDQLHGLVGYSTRLGTACFGPLVIWLGGGFCHARTKDDRKVVRARDTLGFGEAERDGEVYSVRWGCGKFDGRLMQMFNVADCSLEPRVMGRSRQAWRLPVYGDEGFVRKYLGRACEADLCMHAADRPTRYIAWRVWLVCFKKEPPSLHCPHPFGGETE